MRAKSLRRSIAVSLIQVLTCISLHSPGVFNAVAQTVEQRTLRLKTASVTALPPSQKRFALVIGIDQYEDAQINRLQAAANDANSLADALTRYAGFPKDQVILLTTDQTSDRRPTRGNILRRLSNLCSAVPKDGLLLVSFAGHGIERRGRAFLLPTDAQVSGDLALLEETAIPVETPTKWIREAGINQVVVILDACRNNPEATRGDSGHPLTEAYMRGFNFDTRNSDITAFVTFYAAEVGQVAYEYTEKKQGYFTWALIEGLSGRAANDKGEVTLAGLVNYVREVVPKRVGIELGQGKRQRPYVVMEGYKPEELVLALTPIVTKSSPKPGVAPASSAGAYHPLSFEAAEKANKGDYDGAIGDYSYAMKLDPANAIEYRKRLAQVYGSRGLAKYHQANYEGAILDFTKSIEIDPENASAPLYNARGVVRLSTGDDKGAIADFTRAMEISPKFATAYANRAKAYEREGQKARAKDDYDIARKLDPKIFTPSSKIERNSDVMAEAKALMTSGNMKTNKGDYDGAILDYTRAINLNPKYTTAYYLRGNAKLSREYFIGYLIDYKAAAQNGATGLDKDDYKLFSIEFTQELERHPRNAIAYINRGLLHSAKGECKRAMDDVNQAIAIDPNLYIAYVVRGSLRPDTDTRGMLRDLDKAIEINPNSAPAFLLRYLMKSEFGKKKGDEADLEQALKHSSEDANFLTIFIKRIDFNDSLSFLPCGR